MQYLKKFYDESLTRNSYIPILSQSSLKRIQHSSAYIEAISNLIYKDDQNKITKLLNSKKAILVTNEFTFKEIPNDYKIVLEIPLVKPRTWTDKKTFVAVPKNIIINTKL